MGQQHSTGTGGLGDSNSSPSHPSPPSTHLYNGHTLSADESNGVEKERSSPSLLGSRGQSQSVRAAIDNFIAKCLAGGSDDGCTPPSSPKPQDRPVEVVAVLDSDEDGDQDAARDGRGGCSGGGEGSTAKPQGDKLAGVDSGAGGSVGDQSKGSGCVDSWGNSDKSRGNCGPSNCGSVPNTQDRQDRRKEVSQGLQSDAGGRNPELTRTGNGEALSEKVGNEFHEKTSTGSCTQLNSGNDCELSSDKQNNGGSAVPSKSQSPHITRSVALKNSSPKALEGQTGDLSVKGHMLGELNTGGDRYRPSDNKNQLSSDPGDNPQCIKHANEDGSDEPPAPSIRLTTIIDRMLDSSLGNGRGLKTLPVNQRILNQIAVDELSSSQTNQNKKKNEAGEKANNDNKPSDSAGFCFMDHINQAVERTFSSITEEERMEKMLLSSKTADKRQHGFNTQGSKSSQTSSSSTPAPPGSALSVQDMVDQVIHQTKEERKLITQASDVLSSSSGKPLVSSAPSSHHDRAVAEVKNHHNHHHNNHQYHHHHPHQRGTHKEQHHTGRRGRPRMPSPNQDFRHRGQGLDPGHSSRARDGGCENKLQQDYLRSMHATMTKYSQAVMSTTGSFQARMGMPGTTPAVSTQNSVTTSTSDLHHSTAPQLHSMHQRSGVPLAMTRPPPLLRVGDDGELLQHHQRHRQPHQVSRSCGCSVCASHFVRERDADQDRLYQGRVAPGLSPQTNALPLQQAPSPSMQHWPDGEARVSEHSLERGCHAPPFPVQSSMVPNTHSAYPPTTHAYGIQTGVPAPSAAHVDRCGSDTIPPKHPGRGELIPVYRQGNTFEKEIVREPGYQYPSSMAVAKPVPVPRNPCPNSNVDQGRGKPENPNSGFGCPRRGEDIRAGTAADAPLDLSVKKSSSSSFPDRRPREESGYQREVVWTDGRRPVVDGSERNGIRNPLKVAAPMDDQGRTPAPDRMTDAGRSSSASHHLVSLENSVDTYFQKHQDMPGDRGLSPGQSSAGVPHQHVSAAAPLKNIAGVSAPEDAGAYHPFLNARAGVHAHNIRAHALVNGRNVGLDEGVRCCAARGVPVCGSLNTVSPGLHHQGMAAREPSPKVGHGGNGHVSRAHPSSVSAGALPQNVSARVHPQRTVLPHQNTARALSQSIGTGRLPPTQGDGNPHHSGNQQSVLSPFPLQSPTSTSSFRPHMPYLSEHLPSPSTSRPRSQPVGQISGHVLPATHTSSAPSGFPSRGVAMPGRAGAPTTIPTAPEVPTFSMSAAATSLPASGNPVFSQVSVKSCGGDRYNHDRRCSDGSRSASPEDGDSVRGSVSKHEPIQNIIGQTHPQDILYLICRLCRQTYGSPYGFRKHFRNQHGFEPKAEHTLVQTISATKTARQMNGDVNHRPLPDRFPSEHCAPETVNQSSHPASPHPNMVQSNADGSLLGKTCGSAHSREGRVGVHVPDGKGRGSDSLTGGSPPQANKAGGAKCLECGECGQTFQLNDFGSYKQHCRQQHGKGEGGGGDRPGRFTCRDCHVSFHDALQLQQHVQHHHQGHSWAVASPVCAVPFPSDEACQDDVQGVHGTSFPSSLPAKPNPTSPPVSSSGAVSHKVPCSRSADSSVPMFNLTISTPSDLKVCRLPADPVVTSASPDSSSDRKGEREGGGSPDCGKAQDVTDEKNQNSFSDSEKGVRVHTPMSNSELRNSEVIKEDGQVNSPDGSSSIARLAQSQKMDTTPSQKTDRLDSVSDLDTHSTSSRDSQSVQNSVDEDTNLFLYKHKKFSAHRKRSGSNDSSEPEGKKTRFSLETLGEERHAQREVAPVWDKLQTPVSGKDQLEVMPPSDKSQEGVVPESDRHQKEVDKEKHGASERTVNARGEARHAMPFVWDRVTRSQAGKAARSSDQS